ncbi:MAG TPA: GNAT family N-acetyltransferase, partial [Allosphingosinicella sp.]
NVATRFWTLDVGGRTMPVTVDDGALGGSYVCSPHSAYVLYARAELDLLKVGWSAYPSRAALAALDLVLKAARINRIVHLGNWLLSTNLHGGWRGEGVKAAREALAAAHPDHLLGIRSVDDWSSPGLREALIADGWILVPSRQVWVVDDLARDWRPRNEYGNDRRLVARSPLVISDIETVESAEADRIADLYAMLYVGKYSALNPILTPAFIQASAEFGMMSYRVARDPDGTIMAVAGMWQRGGVMTPPVVGYDTAHAKHEGLYRIASWLFMERAMQAGWRLHGSAGAAHFKRLRGARPVIEWNAYHAAHVASARRRSVEALALLLRRFVVPVMVAKQW